MQSGFAIIIGSMILGAGITFAGTITQLTNGYMTEKLQSACWASEVTNGLNNLVVEEVTPGFKNSYISGMSQSDQDLITKSLSVTLSNYAFTKSQDGGGTIDCDASMAFTYTRPDKSVYSNTDGNIVSYEVHPAQGGYSSEMTGNDVPSGVVVYTDDAPSTTGPTGN